MKSAVNEQVPAVMSACGAVIKSVETVVVRHELSTEDQLEYSQCGYKDRTLLLCRITTDDGNDGWGEAFGPTPVYETTIDTVYVPLVLGRSPFDTGVIWELLYNPLRDHGQKECGFQKIWPIFSRN